MTHQLGRSAVLALCFCAIVAAAPLSIVSTGGNSNQTNNSCTLLVGITGGGNCDTQAIAEHPAWDGPVAGSSWVSFAETGNDQGVDFISNPTTVEFYHQFLLPSDWTSAEGSISVMADDTAQVKLNGAVIYDFAVNNSFPTCALNGIGCLDAHRQTIALTESMFDYGAGNQNVFTFVVLQGGGGGYGLSYAASLDGLVPPSEVPEPSTFLLIGAGLAGLYLTRRK